MANFTLSVDDGCASDVRVAELATKYKIDTVFYWPVEWHSLAYDKGYEPLTYRQALAIASKHEIGSHTITHRHLTSIPFEDAKREVIESKAVLEKLFDKSISKFCYPRGYHNADINSVVLSLFDSFRLTRGYDHDGYKLVHIHPNSGANDNKPWTDCINEDKIHLWGHSQDFDRFGLWEELEAVFKEGS